jgi:hypothetical protein
MDFQKYLKYKTKYLSLKGGYKKRGYKKRGGSKEYRLISQDNISKYLKKIFPDIKLDENIDTNSFNIDKLFMRISSPDLYELIAEKFNTEFLSFIAKEEIIYSDKCLRAINHQLNPIVGEFYLYQLKSQEPEDYNRFNYLKYYHFDGSEDYFLDLCIRYNDIYNKYLQESQIDIIHISIEELNYLKNFLKECLNNNNGSFTSGAIIIEVDV